MGVATSSCKIRVNWGAQKVNHFPSDPRGAWGAETGIQPAVWPVLVLTTSSSELSGVKRVRGVGAMGRNGAWALLQLGAPQVVCIGMPGALEGHWPFKLIARLRIFQVLLKNYVSMFPNVKPRVLGQTTGLSSPASCVLWWVAGTGHKGRRCDSLDVPENSPVFGTETSSVRR